jgi:multidrug efflux pump subunit AcrA (membrane-fusion protein)
MQLIESGLKAGERVAVEGLQRLRDGMKVEARLVDLEDSPGAAAEAAAKG